MIKLSKIIPVIILLIAVISLNYLNNFINQYFLWLFYSIITILYILAKNKLTFKKERKYFFWLNVYITWVAISLFIGLFKAEMYWDYKALVINGFGLLTPLAAYISLNSKVLQRTIKNYILYAIPILIIFLPFLEHVGVLGFYVSTFYFIVLFTPIIPLRWRYIIVIAAITIVTSMYDDRAVVLRISFALILSVTYYFRKLISVKTFKFIWYILILSPVFFLLIAISTPFNILRIGDYYKTGIVFEEKRADGSIIRNDLFADTRASIFVDVFITVVKYDSWWFGVSPARGYETTFESERNKQNTGRSERARSELGIVNVFLWMGIIGALLYFIIFVKASYLAIYKSNNYWSKILGIFIAFRWALAWVEDMPDVTLNYFILMLMIGLAYSNWFRSMSNKEVEYWVRGIFLKKYRIK